MAISCAVDTCGSPRRKREWCDRVRLAHLSCNAKRDDLFAGLRMEASE